MLHKLTANKIASEVMMPLVHELVGHYARVAQPLRILLFGSLAKNTFTDVSDIDIAMIFSTQVELKSARDRIAKNRFKADWPVDLLLFDRDTYERKSKVGGVCFLIREEGIVMYDVEKAKA